MDTSFMAEQEKRDRLWRDSEFVIAYPGSPRRVKVGTLHRPKCHTMRLMGRAIQRRPADVFPISLESFVCVNNTKICKACASDVIEKLGR